MGYSQPQIDRMSDQLREGRPLDLALQLDLVGELARMRVEAIEASEREDALRKALEEGHWIPTAERKPLEGQIVCAYWTFQGKHWYEVALYHSGGKFSPWSDELNCYDPDCTIPYPSHWCELRPGTTVRP